MVRNDGFPIVAHFQGNSWNANISHLWNLWMDKAQPWNIKRHWKQTQPLQPLSVHIATGFHWKSSVAEALLFLAFLWTNARPECVYVHVCACRVFVYVTCKRILLTRSPHLWAHYYCVLHIHLVEPTSHFDSSAQRTVVFQFHHMITDSVCDVCLNPNAEWSIYHSHILCKITNLPREKKYVNYE